VPTERRPLAIVSSYRPATSLLPLISVLERSADVVVVDDGSGDGFQAPFSEARAQGHRVETLARNSGIAAALNVGVRIAKAEGYPAVVTFDQDSMPDPELIGALSDRAARDPRAGAIVPEYFADVRQALSATDDRARRVIQSGMFLPMSTIDEVGAFDEDLFIDLVDTEYEMRCLSAGREILVARGTRLGHELGRTAALRPLAPLGWPTVRTMVSTPFRYYFRARNRVILLRRYFRAAPGRMTGDAARDMLYLAVIICSARPRRALAALVGRGLADGARSRGGAMPSSLRPLAERVSWREA
jgi:rhamnosyltransferase